MQTEDNEGRDDLIEEEEVQENEDQGQPEDRDGDQNPDGLRKALRSERKNNRALTTRVAELEKKLSRHSGSRKTAERDAEADVEQIKAAVREQADQEWSTRLLTSEAVTELIAADVRGNPRRVARMLDLDGVSVTDGRVDLEALRDAIEDLKADSPELFRRTRKRDAEDEDNERDQQPARRRAGNADLGRQKSPVGSGASTNSLESALRRAVGA